jgi:chemosensory pili system protein ChpA (sensor histidine kinase/response regulator)
MDDEDNQLEMIFLSETRQHLNSLHKAMTELRPNDRVNSTLLRATHSLKGCANIAQVTSIALISSAFDKSLQDLHKYDVALSEQQISLISETISGIEGLVNSIENNTAEPDVRPLNDNCYFLIADLPSTPSSPPLVDPDVLLVFLEETDALLGEYTQKLRKLQRQPDSLDHREAIHDLLLKLSDNAQHAEQDSIAELYRQLDRVIQSQPILDQSCFDILETGYEHLNNDIESLLQNKVVSNEYVFTEQVDEFLAQKEQQEEQSSVTPVTFDPPEVDFELLEAFIEENAELLESSGEAIKQWQATPNNNQASMQLQRDLHTLKGAARAIGQEPIGELTHQTESLVIAVSNGKLSADNEFFNLLHRCQDRLAEMQEQLAAQTPLQYAHDLAKDIAILSGEQEAVSTPKSVLTTPRPPQPQAQPEAKNEPIAPAHVEQIRVRADLLDYLSNFAGEVSISRDRVNQQNAAIHQQLREMEDTVSRLHEQLRNLEIEIEN